MRERLPEWVTGAVQPIIAEALADRSLAAVIRVDGERLFIDHAATATGSGYVAPSVMLEFGARSTGEPASLRDVACDAAGLVDGVEFAIARPRVMHAERTFPVCGSSAPFQTTSTEDPAYMNQQALSAFIWSV